MVITAGSFDLLVEVVAESDEHLLEIISKRIRTIPRCVHRVLRLPPAAQADLLVGRALTAGRSLWQDTAAPTAPRPPLAGDTDCDVAVVGAGFTGLWTAYYLLRPTRRCAWWCWRPRPSASAPRAATAAGARRCSRCRPTGWRAAGLDRDARPRAARRDAGSVDEVGRVARRPRASTPTAAKGGTDRRRAQRGAAAARPRRGRARPRLGPRPRTTAAARRRARPATWSGSRTRSARRTPRDCAARPPAAAGARPRRCGRAARRHDPRGHPGAATRAGRGHAPSRHGQRRRRGPRHRGLHPGAARPPPGARSRSTPSSSPPSRSPTRTWAEIGLRRPRPSASTATSSSTASALPTAGSCSAGAARRTTSGRRCAPSTTREGVLAALRATLRRPVPGRSRDARFTHAWGGPLGIPRDWCASVGLDRSTGIGLGGRLRRRRREHDEPRRPHAARPGPRRRHRAHPTAVGAAISHAAWEPEPLRWLGINAGLRAMSLADREERADRAAEPRRAA